MKLRLVLKDSEYFPGAQHEKMLENGAIIIGRSPQADWIIPDPERIISKAHCRVEKNVNDFVLIDTSVNGISINGKLISRGVPTLLANGDILALGKIVIIVSIEMSREQIGIETQFTTTGIAKEPDHPFLEGPFGFDDEKSPPPQSIATRNDVRPVVSDMETPLLRDWWKPDFAVMNTESSKFKNIAAREVQIGAIDANIAPQTLSSSGNVMTKFLTMLEGVDIRSLARAIEMATMVLPIEERQKFTNRLSRLLHEETLR